MHCSSCPKRPKKVLRLWVSPEAVGYHMVSPQWEDVKAKQGNANPVPTEFQQRKSARRPEEMGFWGKVLPKATTEQEKSMLQPADHAHTSMAVNVLLKQNTSGTQHSLHAEALQGHDAKPMQPGTRTLHRLQNAATAMDNRRFHPWQRLSSSAR